MPGVPLIWIAVGQGPTVLAVGAGGRCLAIFSHVYHFSFPSSLWEAPRYRLTHYLKGSFNTVYGAHTHNPTAIKLKWCSAELPVGLLTINPHMTVIRKCSHALAGDPADARLCMFYQIM